MKQNSRGLALNMEATADALEVLSKMDSRLKRTEQLTSLLQDELMGTRKFKNGNLSYIVTLLLQICNDAISDAEIEDFFGDREKKLRYGSFLAGLLNWDLHWPRNIIQQIFANEYLAEHKWPSDT